MAVVIWDPNWFPPEDMDDVILMRRVYLSSINTNLEHYSKFEFLPNEIWSKDFYNTYPITDDLPFKTEGKLFRRQLLYGTYSKNDKKYIVLVQNTLEGFWASQNGLIIFAEFFTLEDWQDLKDDLIAGKDIKDLLKYRTIEKFPP